MTTTFEADFGNFKIEPSSTKIRHSPWNENEFFVILSDRKFPSTLLKGTATYKRYYKESPKCPHCQERLPDNFGLIQRELAEVMVFSGAVIKSIQYHTECVELCVGYEQMVFNGRLNQENY